MSTPSLSQLKRAITISEKIEALQAELLSILGNPGKRAYTKRAAEDSGEAAPVKKKRKKAQMSEEGRARIVAAQKARWAKIKKEKS